MERISRAGNFLLTKPSNRLVMVIRAILVGAATAVSLFSRPATSGEFSGETGFESRLFPNDAPDARLEDAGFSVALEPEFYHEWDDGNQRFVVVPYV